MPNYSLKTGNKERPPMFGGTEGVALVEFAVTLPLLLVMIVGIFDFGNAFNLKQKVLHAASAGAVAAAGQATNDLGSAGTPNSVIAVRDAVDNYLKSEGVNDCGLGGAAGSGPSGTTLNWTFQSSGSCISPITVSIERSSNLLASVGGTNINMISTHVSIAYPYTWYFGHVSRLLPGGGTPALPGQILVDAFAPNLD